MKRALDIIFSFAGIIILLPLMLVVALLIVLESPGAPVYKSVRVGRNWKKFNFYKFRTMRADSDKEWENLQNRNSYLDIYLDPEELDLDQSLMDVHLFGDTYYVNEYNYLNETCKRANSIYLKVEDDPRITRLGHFLRATSLDELPQLLSVLKGDMSIVGNRPLVVAEAELLTDDVYAKRFDCPAGITGLWQVQPDKDTMKAERRRQIDVTYAERQSLALDLKIVFSTVKKVFSHGNV